MSAVDEQGGQGYFANAPIWNKVMKMEWILQHEDLANFASYQEYEFYFSPGFYDESIDLYLHPDGIREEDEDSFGLIIYKLPKGIHECDVKVHMSSNIKD